MFWNVNHLFFGLKFICHVHGMFKKKPKTFLKTCLLLAYWYYFLVVKHFFLKPSTRFGCFNFDETSQFKVILVLCHKVNMVTHLWLIHKFTILVKYFLSWKRTSLLQGRYVCDLVTYEEIANVTAWLRFAGQYFLTSSDSLYDCHSEWIA